MTREQVFQLKTMSLQFVQNLPGDYLGNAEKVYQWLTQEVREAEETAKNRTSGVTQVVSLNSTPGDFKLV